MVQKWVYTNKLFLTSHQLPTAWARFIPASPVLAALPSSSRSSHGPSLPRPGLEWQQWHHALLGTGKLSAAVCPSSPTPWQGHGKQRRRHLCWLEERRTREQLRNAWLQHPPTLWSLPAPCTLLCPVLGRVPAWELYNSLSRSSEAEPGMLQAEDSQSLLPA